jgi:hypothetical protein
MTPQEQINTRLVTYYKNSFERLLKRIANLPPGAAWDGFYKRLLKEIELTVADLDIEAARELAALVKKAYTGAETQALKNIQAGPFGGLNREAMQLIAENAVDELANANRYFGRHTADTIRKIGLDTVAEKLSTGQTIPQIKKRIAEQLRTQGMIAMTDSAGRKHRLDSYAELVARTTTSEATNTASMETGRQLGYDLVKFTTHSPTCEVCAPIQGRVFSVSGKDTRFPALSSVPGFDKGFKTIHPRCRHKLVITVEALWTEEERAKYLADANKPVRGDTRAQAEVDKYNAIQAEKRERWQDRRQWEKYRAKYPEYAHKTFSEFRRDKAANGNRYQTMLKANRLNGIPKDAIMVPRSVGAKAKDIYVSYDLNGKKIKVPLEPGSKIEKVVVFAGQGTKKEIRERYRLEALQHANADGWRKVTGEGIIIVSGKKIRTEIHWYEHDDIGSIMHKVKKVIDDGTKQS